tara:strand:- start:8110 stop:8346 length:237 start_codon:yes stop_codon:yes gene_type:complete
MENQEVLKAIATLADKVSRYHERLLAVEREKEKLEKTLSEHLHACSCHNVIQGKPYKSDTEIMVSGLDSEVECEACSA